MSIYYKLSCGRKSEPIGFKFGRSIGRSCTQIGMDEERVHYHVNWELLFFSKRLKC